MVKRQREELCSVCYHYHRVEQGEACAECGHQGAVSPPSSEAFSSEILPFLFLGTYDHATRSQIMQLQGITHVLNTVPDCPILRTDSFVYYPCPQGGPALALNEWVEFIETARLARGKVLVHCMSGQSKSAAVVIAYLMKHLGYTLAQSYEFVKERRPCVNLKPEAQELLQEFEAQTLGKST